MAGSSESVSQGTTRSAGTEALAGRTDRSVLSPVVAFAGLGVATVLIVSVWLFDVPFLLSKGQVIVTAIALTSLGLLCTKLMARDRPVRRALASLQLGPWMGVGFTAGFGVATLAWLAGDLSYRGIVTSLSLTGGAVIAAIGFVAATVGYLTVPTFSRSWAARLDHRARCALTFRPRASTVWKLFLIAMAGYALQFMTGTVGYLSDPSAALSTTSSSGALFAAMTQLGLLATLVAAWRYATLRTGGSIALLAVVSLSQISIGLFSGVKEAGIVQLLAVVIGLSALGRLKVRPLIAAGLITFFVITPLVSTYRQLVVVGSSRLTASQVIDTVDLGSVISSALGADDPNGRVGTSSWGRWSRLGDVAIIVNQSPSPIPFASPTELLVAPILGFVPRSIWPDKPVLDAGYQINQLYYHSAPGSYSSAAATPYGDLFRHGGIPVVLLGMVLFGGLLRLVDSRPPRGGSNDPRVLFLPMLLFTGVVKQEVAEHDLPNSSLCASFR